MGEGPAGTVRFEVDGGQEEPGANRHSRKLSFWKLEMKRTSSIDLLVINKSLMLLTRPRAPQRTGKSDSVYH